jgi:hypothetical protein
MLTMNLKIPDYSLFSGTHRTNAQEQLRHDHQHFYHFTLDCHISSIKQRGLDPYFESVDSKYGPRNREPSRAIRYCTRNFLEVGLGAAITRAQVWDETQGIHVPGAAQIVLLRTNASILSRSFGLDHSFGDITTAAEVMLQSKKYFTADEFISLIRKYGAISSYEMIPANELELCNDDVKGFCKYAEGRFTRLHQ